MTLLNPPTFELLHFSLREGEKEVVTKKRVCEREREMLKAYEENGNTLVGECAGTVGP